MALTRERLIELYCVTCEGVFVRKSDRGGRKAGTVAGTRDKDGYIVLAVDGKEYKAHRLVWLYNHGSFPLKGLDHINGVKDDNRLCNLREATKSENACNLRKLRSDNTTGYLGVKYVKRVDKYCASIMLNYKSKHLGYFSTAERASEAYIKAKRELHEFGTI